MEHREKLVSAMRHIQTGRRFRVLFTYTLAIAALPAVGRCEPTHPPLHNVRSGFVAPKSPNRPHLDPRRGEPQSRALFAHPERRDGTEAERSGGKPEERVRAKMASPASLRDRRLINRYTAKQAQGGFTVSSDKPPHGDCNSGKIQQVVYGKFYIVGHLEVNTRKVGDQSDSTASGQTRVRGQRLGGSEESWQRLQPVVECGDDAMTLVVRKRRAEHLLLDRANESSVPLLQLPPRCGYSVQTTWRDLSLVAQYDACHVTQEDDGYVLPLLWRGTPVRMSCPASRTQPRAAGLPSVCCSPDGVTVRAQGVSAADELRVNVRGEWSPLVLLAEQCSYTVDRREAEVVIAAPYLACGITVKDGRYTLSLQIGDETFTLSCPVPPPEDLPPTHRPPVDGPHRLSRGPAQPVTETPEPFQWAPPFYLAPLYYPHPTYHNTYPRPDVHEGRVPPPPSPSTPDPTLVPQPLPPVDSQPSYPDYYSYRIPVEESHKLFGAHGSHSSTDEMEDSSQVFPDLHEKLGTPAHSPSSATGFPLQGEAPSPQPPSHAFSPYYHYYHHPKIPLPDQPQDPGPGPEVPEERSSQTRRFQMLPPDVQQSEANSDQFPQPVPDSASHPHINPAGPELVLTAPPAAYPQPYPHHYFYYFPHIAKGQAKRLTSPPRDVDAGATFSNVGPLSRSLELHDEYDVNPHIDPRDEMINSERFKSVWVKNPLFSEDDVKPELGRHSQPPLPPAYPPEPDPVAPPPPSPTNHNPPPHPYHHHPYYHYYQMYYGPERLQGADGRVSPDPLLQASSLPAQHPSYHRHQTTTLPELLRDVQNGHLHPHYYYYHLFHQPTELRPTGSMDSEKVTSTSGPQLPSDPSWMDVLLHAAGAGFPSIPQPLHDPYYHGFHSHHVAQQPPRDPVGPPVGGGAGEGLGDETTDRLVANTPSPSPCRLGPVSAFDCADSLGCCSYPVKDCTMGQHLVFVVPDSVSEPTLAPPAHPSEDGGVSCTPQRLTSDPHIYVVPLDGCGVNKYVFGQTQVHLLEVQASLQRDPSSVQENTPVRLMVECSSTPGSSGEVRLRVMDRLPPPPLQSTPATVTVQLRIATDESYTSYHPGAHLPLGLIRGRPLYLEVSVLDPPEPDLVLLVHSCLAYTQPPHASWMLIYSGCPIQGDSQMLPSHRSGPRQRIVISSFLYLPSEGPSYTAQGGRNLLQEPEIYFLCLTEVCSAADGDCTVGCISRPHSDT